MFLGIDLGTSSVKILALHEDGTIIGSVSETYPVHYYNVNWAEQNPLDWWEAVVAGIKRLLLEERFEPGSIRGIGLSGQMHGLVCLDQSNDIIRPAILWCDQRTGLECDEITIEIGAKRLSELTGNKALTGFTAPKLLWVKKNEPEHYKRIAHVLLPKDYIRFMLTGSYATDVSDASGTLMLDVKGRCWSEEMVSYLDLKKEVLPSVYESYEITGYLSNEVKALLGLTGDIFVVAGGGDQAAGAIGTGTTKEGIISVALGTSGVVFAATDQCVVDDHNRMHSFCHSNGMWHLMGVMLSAASSLKWWVEEVQKGTSHSFDELLAEAGNVPACSEGLFFLPYLMGERTPYSNPNARGGFVGLTMKHGRPQMTKAVLEGVSFGLYDSLEIIKEMTSTITEVRVSGGGARSDLWKQIVSDMFGAPVVTLNSVEGPAFGAAILAIAASGAYRSVDEACSAIIRKEKTLMPNMANNALYMKHHVIYKDLYKQLKSVYENISCLY